MVGLRPSYAAYVRWDERGAPVQFLWASVRAHTAQIHLEPDRRLNHTSRFEGKDLVRRQEIRRHDGRNIRQRQDLFRHFDAQHIAHKLPPLLTASVAIRESVLQLLPQIFIGQNKPVLHARRSIYRRTGDDIYLDCHARMKRDIRVRIDRRAEPLIEVNQVTWIEENAETLKGQSIVNQAAQLPPGGTGLEQSKPFAHYLEIETGKVLHITGGGRRQVMERRCNPS